MTTTTLDLRKVKQMVSNNKPQGDVGTARQIFGIVSALLVFGAVEVFSASRYQAVQLTNNLYYFGLLHLGFVVLTLISILVMQSLSTKIWKKLTWVGILGLLALLVGVFFFSAENGSHRWIPLGATGFNIQPSEFAKIGVIVLGGLLFSTAKWEIDKKHSDHLIRLAIMSIPVGIILALILFQPDLGNVIIIGGAYVIMYWLTTNKWKVKDTLVILMVVAVVAVAAIAVEPYRLERITTQFEFMRTGEIQDEYGKGLQLRNILIGVGSGGLWGKGIGGSRLKYGYFVEVTAFTDSISAVIFEELGFILGSVFVGIYVYLFYLFVRVAESQQTQYQRLIMWGITIWFVIQTFMHFGANVALIPVKGTTLPFVSYGGSSMLAFGIAAGMAIRLCRNPSETA